MSGGAKESPRQKMIGMMYLFYTSLLALQVANSVLDRFVFINRSLESQVKENTTKDMGILTAIGQQVTKRGDRENDKLILQKATDVRTRTSQLISYMDSLKSTMVQITGGYNDKGEIVGAKDMEKVANLMVNQNKGAELKKKLNDYAAFLTQQIGKDDFPPLAMDGKDSPYYSKDPDQRVKDFAELFFETTPTVAGIATVSQMETEVMGDESRALNDLAAQVGAEEVRFDTVIVMALPESNSVAAGAKYKAQLFLAAGSKSANPKMLVNGDSIPVQNGFGQVEFNVSGGNYDKSGKEQKSYQAQIIYNGQTYTQDINYFAVRPVMQITSASVNALYLNCGNELNVLVPALGTNYNPTFSLTGNGDAIKDPTVIGRVTIVPRGPKVTLHVSSNGNHVGDQEFNVKPIPKPDIVLLADGKEVDPKSGLPNCPRSLTMKAVPDEGFEKFLPKDARYRVTKWTVYLAHGSSPKAPPVDVTSENVNITNLAAQAKDGDKILCVVHLVQRMNFQNKIEDVNMGKEVVREFPIGK